MIAALTGDEVEGERLRGRVMPSGGDWATIDDNDTLRLDARITMETHDGPLIYVSYRGVLRPLSLEHKHARNGGPKPDAEKAAISIPPAPQVQPLHETKRRLNHQPPPQPAP